MKTPRVIVHEPDPPCCSPCDVVTFHFAGDYEVHAYSSGLPRRLAGRLARLVRDLVEFPSAVAEVAGVDSGQHSGLTKRRTR